MLTILRYRMILLTVLGLLLGLGTQPAFCEDEVFEGPGADEPFDPNEPGADDPRFTPGPGADPPLVTDARSPFFAAHSNNTLGVAMYHEMLKMQAKEGKENENLFFSPISISAALMLTYEGARNDTLDEFEKVLSITGDDRSLAHAAYAKTLNKLDGEGKPYELSVANMLWGEKTMPFSNAFLGTLNKHYDANFKSVNFIGDPEAQRTRINSWVSKRTKERIQDLLPPGSIHPDVRLVLVNAIYFKAPWNSPFVKGYTHDRDFHLLPLGEEAHKTVKVPMMAQDRAEIYEYADLDGFTAVKLPYKSGDLSMVVLLPDEKHGLPTLEKKLSAELIDESIREMKRKYVHVVLPKWKTTQPFKLKPALQAMGMTDAFTRAADFTGVSDSEEAKRLFIDNVYHKAFIEVDEAGTEAAAATAVVIRAESAGPRGELFQCDRPFVYLIRDERTGAILFMGRVTDPS